MRDEDDQRVQLGPRVDENGSPLGGGVYLAKWRWFDELSLVEKQSEWGIGWDWKNQRAQLSDTQPAGEVDSNEVLAKKILADVMESLLGSIGSREQG